MQTQNSRDGPQGTCNPITMPCNLYNRFHVPSLVYRFVSPLFLFFYCVVPDLPFFEIQHFFVFPLCLNFVRICFLLFPSFKPMLTCACLIFGVKAWIWLKPRVKLTDRGSVTLHCGACWGVCQRQQGHRVVQQQKFGHAEGPTWVDFAIRRKRNARERFFALVAELLKDAPEG